MALSWPLNSFAWLVIDYCKGIDDVTLPFIANLQFSKLKVTDKWLTYHVEPLVPVKHPIAQYCRYHVTKKFTLSNSAVVYMLQSLVNGRLRVQFMSQQLRNPCVIMVANLSIITLKSRLAYTNNFQNTVLSATKIASSSWEQNLTCKRASK